MIKVHAEYFNNNSDDFENFNSLEPLSLGVHFVTLNSSNIDENVIDYINFFTSRNGYREINTAPVSDESPYKI